MTSRKDHDDAAAIAAIDITDELFTRPAPPPDHASENSALHNLARHLLSGDPQALLQAVCDIALELCQAGSAGVSLLEGQGGQTVFRWTANAGAYAALTGRSTPRDNSPCGLCLDRGKIILLAEPARIYTFCDEIDAPSAVEALLVPLRDPDGADLGALWTLSHTNRCRFHREHARILKSLGSFAALALCSIQESALKSAFVREANHRIRNNLQLVSSLIGVQEAAAANSEIRRELATIRRRILAVAEVHERIAYGLRSAEVDLPAALKAISNRLASALGNIGVAVMFDDAQRFKNLDPLRAQIICLIVSELVTNAMKHAFQRGESGTIRVSFTCSDAGMIKLCVADNGCPLPEGLTPTSTSRTGLKLLDALAQQLHGNFRIEREPKTFVVEFPAP